MLLDEKWKLISWFLYYEIGVERKLKFCPILDPKFKSQDQISWDTISDKKGLKVQLCPQNFKWYHYSINNNFPLHASIFCAESNFVAIDWRRFPDSPDYEKAQTFQGK